VGLIHQVGARIAKEQGKTLGEVFFGKAPVRVEHCYDRIRGEHADFLILDEAVDISSVWSLWRNLRVLTPRNNVERNSR
jgi:hypothetical protein